jgi:very-short-patch-repair endonuclease
MRRKRILRPFDSADEAAEAAAARLAERQHGVVARHQLVALGMLEGQIERRLKRGYLHRVYRGVYAVGHRRLTREGRWMAAVLASSAEAVLSHRSAACLWGLRAWRGEEEVSRPGRFRHQKGIRAHRAAVPPDEISVVEGIPVTSPFRTAFDLAAVVGERELERLWNEVKVRGLTDRLSPWEFLRRYPRRRGTLAWRRLLESEAPEGIMRSELEEAFVAFLDAWGLSRPRFNGSVAVRDGFLEVDCLWDDARLAVELDGRAFHDTAHGFEADRRRDRLLLSEGWRTMRITWRQLQDEPDAVAADLRTALQFTRP